MHIYQPWQKGLQNFKLIYIKLQDEFHTQGTHGNALW